MILYEIKLISHDTNEVLFRSVGKKVTLPPPELTRKYPRATLYVTTLDSSAVDSHAQDTEKSKAA